MIYVTHDQVEAMTLANKIVVMNAGRIQQIGSTQLGLSINPANIFVAGFIGSPAMNFLDASALGMSGAKTIGLRPEHFSISPDRGEWAAKVIHIEHLGADTNIYLETQTGQDSLPFANLVKCIST